MSDISVKITYADNKDGSGSVPVEIYVYRNDELVYGSAIYASEKHVNIPSYLKEVCKSAPDILSVKDDIKGYNISSAI